MANRPLSPLGNHQLFLPVNLRLNLPPSHLRNLVRFLLFSLLPNRPLILAANQRAFLHRYPLLFLPVSQLVSLQTIHRHNRPRTPHLNLLVFHLPNPQLFPLCNQLRDLLRNLLDNPPLFLQLSQVVSLPIFRLLFQLANRLGYRLPNPPLFQLHNLRVFLLLNRPLSPPLDLLVFRRGNHPGYQHLNQL